MAPGAFSDAFSNAFDGGGGTPPSAPPCSYTYALQADSENIWGVENIAKWADIENTQSNVVIANRMGWALCLATAQIDDKLRGGPYVVPFTSPYPLQIADACARLAGILVYESRGVVDFNAKGDVVHQLAWHRKMVFKLLGNIRSGRVRIGGMPTVTTIPRAILVRPRRGEDEMSRAREELQQYYAQRDYFG